jgi:hypothetical protein
MNTPENFQLRPARVEDVPVILELIRDLAAYERARFIFIIFPPG